MEFWKKCDPFGNISIFRSIQKIIDDFTRVLTQDEITANPKRPYLTDCKVESDTNSAQYFLLHADLISSDFNSDIPLDGLAEGSLASKFANKGKERQRSAFKINSSFLF